MPDGNNAMIRPTDREIEAWSRKSKRQQLALLWDEYERDGVKVISCWEETDWSSVYVISASQSKRPKPGKWWAICFVDFGHREADKVVFSDDRAGEAAPAPIRDAREIRYLLETNGIDERDELCELLITLGSRRDEIDIPLISAFAGHEDKVVRYTVLGMLSWQPSVTNADLGARFGKDTDPRVEDLAVRFAAGRAPRRTRI
ncbi:MAG: hypothetical protein KDB48_03100 [Solirubrobacterales bacterium]|nr:hypothetical protein [Solirubrobacterales bacterium]HMT05591.1 hypothetical protein [Solirubrobacterales bacterium]